MTNMNNVKPTLSEKKFGALCRKAPPIGCLAECHPQLHFAAVLKVENKYIATGFGGTLELTTGTKIKLWSGEILTL